MDQDHAIKRLVSEKAARENSAPDAKLTNRLQIDPHNCHDEDNKINYESSWNGKGNDAMEVKRTALPVEDDPRVPAIVSNGDKSVLNVLLQSGAIGFQF